MQGVKIIYMNINESPKPSLVESKSLNKPFKKNHVVILIVFFLLILSTCTFFYIKYIKGPFIVHKVYPSISNNPFNTIHEINQKKISSGIYNTEGYVIYKSRECGDCPKGAMCSFCEPSYIIISEKYIRYVDRPAIDSEIRISTDGNEQFEYGKKYKFSVKINNSAMHSIELVGFNISK